MTDNREIYESLVNRFNKEARTHIRLSESVKNVILPKVDIEGQTIRFNDRLETMMMLFILAFYWFVRNPDSIMRLFGL